MEFLNTTTQLIVGTHHNDLKVSLAIYLITSLLLIIGYFFIRDIGLPPGPTGVPILGYWPFLKSDIFHQQTSFKKKYGDVFSFRVTGKLFVNLASNKVLREAFITKGDCFMERTSEFNILRQIFPNGIFASSREKWQTVRKFFVNQFREKGMSIYKENTAEVMNEMTDTLVDELRKNGDQPIDLLKVLMQKINSIMRQTMLGPHTPFTETEILKFQTNYRALTSLLHFSNVALTGNVAKYLIAPFLPFYREGMKIHKNTMDIILKIIEDHKKTFDSHNIRDLIDNFLDEKNRRKMRGDPTAMYFTDEILASNIFQFVTDGAFNATTFIAFTLKALLDNQEEQDKIYRELVEVCGEDRNPSFADRNQLTYTNAFLLEAQRVSKFVPLIPNSQCTKKTTVGGYVIPKGAMTISNVYAIHMDPKEYHEPEKFNPLRFMNKDGKPKEEYPITFGVGKRVCVGESFGLMQAFLFTAVMVKNFKLYYYNPKDQHTVKRARSLTITVIPRKL